MIRRQFDGLRGVRVVDPHGCVEVGSLVNRHRFDMSTITECDGPSPEAFLVVPLIGAFFIDLMNAAVIKFFIGVLGGAG